MNEHDILKHVTRIVSEVLDFETLVLERSMKASHERWSTRSMRASSARRPAAEKGTR